MTGSQRTLIGIALVAFAYAVLGNYVALPGYLRFLDRGGTSLVGNTLDVEVVLGAARTILRMYSFNLGALCLYWCVLLRDCPRHLTGGVVVGVLWLAVWSVPRWPGMPAAFCSTRRRPSSCWRCSSPGGASRPRAVWRRGRARQGPGQQECCPGAAR